MEKTNKIAKVLNTVFKVVHILAVVGLVTLIVATALLSVGLLLNLDPNTVGTGFNALDIGNLTLTLAPSVAPDVKMVMVCGLVTILLEIVFMAVMLPAIKRIRLILQPMAEGKPFENSICSDLKKLGWLAIVLGVISNVINLAANAINVFVFRLPELLSSLFRDGMVSNVEIMGVFDGTFLLIAGVIFLMAYVFEYGAELQKLSDETL